MNAAVCKCAFIDGYRIRRRGCPQHASRDAEYWEEVDSKAKDLETPSYFDVVFEGAPGPDRQVFVETENEKGESISIGFWVERDDGYWALRIPRPQG